MQQAAFSVAFSVFLSSSAFGQWQLMDNFNAYSDGQIFLNAEDIGWHATTTNGTDEYWMIVDPYDRSNTCLYVEAGYSDIDFVYVFLVKDLPGGGIAPGDSGTLYFRCLWAGIGNTWHIGTADKALAFDEETGLQTTPGAWSDYNALIRLGDASNIEHRDGDGYLSTNPPLVVGVNHWYQFWLVVENTWDENTVPPTSTGLYTLYVQGPGFGDGTTPFLVPVGTNPAKNSAALRRPPADEAGNPQSIIWAMFATSSTPFRGCAGDVYILDDFYFCSGKNLTDPRLPPFGTGPNEHGDLDTGDWLGWINIRTAPYLWSYSLSCWFYMEAPAPDAPGAWGYFYK